MRVVLLLLAMLACGLAPVVAQPEIDEEDISVNFLALCVAASLQTNYSEGPACPSSGPWTLKVWNVECNPLCYPTYFETAMSTSGQCYYDTEGLNSWEHCSYVPPYQLVYIGSEFRARGANGHAYSTSLDTHGCGLQQVDLIESCGTCDDIWTCLEDPVILSVEDSHYELTDTKSGVEFDLNGDGEAEQIPWTAGEDDAFLVLDRNGNGSIDDGSELFSHISPQQPSRTPNGFRALRMFDDPLNGGNDDGRVSAKDEIYGSLQLWLDADRDGNTDAGELVSLSSVGLTEIELDYTDDLAHDDEHGNTFRYSAPAHFADGRSVPAWVVFFNIEKCSGS